MKNPFSHIASKYKLFENLKRAIVKIISQHPVFNNTIISHCPIAQVILPSFSHTAEMVSAHHAYRCIHREETGSHMHSPTTWDAQRKGPHVGGARRGLGVLIPKAQPKAGFGLDLRVLNPPFSGLRTPLLALILVSLPRLPQEGMDTQLREPHLVWAQPRLLAPRSVGGCSRISSRTKGLAPTCRLIEGWLGCLIS